MAQPGQAIKLVLGRNEPLSSESSFFLVHVATLRRSASSVNLGGQIEVGLRLHRNICCAAGLPRHCLLSHDGLYCPQSRVPDSAVALHFCRCSMSAPMPETWVLLRQLNKEWLLHERRRCCTQLRDVGVDRKNFPFRNQALTWRLGQLALDSSLEGKGSVSVLF